MKNSKVLVSALALAAILTACPSSAGGSDGPVVTGVTVSPAAAVVNKGGTQTFTATVTGTGDPAQTVTWGVAGDGNTGTSISAAGVLAVAAGETASSLTVTATSAADTSKSGTAAVTVGPTLPGFPATDVDVAFPTDVNGLSFGLLSPSNSSHENNLGAEIITVFTYMREQSDNFVKWFDEAEETYPALSAMFGALKAKENEVKTTVGTATRGPAYLTAVEDKVDGILDTVIGNAGSARDNFDKSLAAHSKGAYINQRQWNGTLAAGDNKAAQIAEFQSLCAAVDNLSKQPVVNTSSGNVIDMNIIMNELKGNMRNALSTGFGFTAADTNGTAMINALITQIAEDLPQFKAFVKDMQNQGMSLGITVDVAPVGVAMGPTTDTKATHLAADDSFTPAYLRTRTKDDETEMV